VLSGGFVVPRRRSLGVLDVPLVLFAPRALFSKAENVNRYGSTLLVLLACFTLVGYASIQTGLIDREVQKSVAQRQAELEKATEDNVVARSELIKQLEEARKLGEFQRYTNRILVVAARPLGQLAVILLTASLLYGAVALTGRKPEWHTLMTICVFAGFADLARQTIRLVLMVQHASMEVDTSAALLLRLVPEGYDITAAPVGAFNKAFHLLGNPYLPWLYLIGGVAGYGALRFLRLRVKRRWVRVFTAGLSALTVGFIVSFLGQATLSLSNGPLIAQRILSGIDPFHVWFWLLVIGGLATTTQLRASRAWVTCGLFWLVATGVRIGLGFAAGNGPPTSA